MIEHNNQYRGYVNEVVHYANAHVQQVLTNGYCNCTRAMDDPYNTQRYCLPAERLASIMRGEPQHFRQAHYASMYEYDWLMAPPKQDDDEPF